MSSELDIPNSEAAILARLIQGKEQMNREVAEYLLSIDFSREDVERMNLLAERRERRNFISRRNRRTR
jgi:hypothetical protein